MHSVFSSSLPDIKTLHTVSSKAHNGLRLPPISKPCTAPVIKSEELFVVKRKNNLNGILKKTALRPSRIIMVAPPPPTDNLIKFNSILDDYAIGEKLGEGSCS